MATGGRDAIPPPIEWTFLHTLGVPGESGPCGEGVPSTSETIMTRQLLGAVTASLFLPIALAAQDAAVCSEPGAVASVVVHAGDPIDDLTVWRGTTSAGARTPAWREVTCVMAEETAVGAMPEIPEDWSVPDLGLIESLLFQSAEVRELRSFEPTAAAEPLTLAGTSAARSAEVVSPRGVRAVFMDPQEPDRPLHVVVERMTPTFVAVVVESSAGSIGLSWERSLEDPTWRRVESGV